MLSEKKSINQLQAGFQKRFTRVDATCSCHPGLYGRLREREPTGHSFKHNCKPKMAWKTLAVRMLDVLTLDFTSVNLRREEEREREILSNIDLCTKMIPRQAYGQKLWAKVLLPPNEWGEPTD